LLSGSTTVLMVLLSLLSSAPPDPEAMRKELVAELAASFAARLDDSETYARTVARECRGFPEGDLFPHLFPLHAFAGMAHEGLMEMERARELSSALLALAIPVVAGRVNAPNGDLSKLKSYRKQATYICQLNVALGRYRLLGGHDHDAVHDHLTLLIRNALAHAQGKPLRSFPSYSWPFDTVPCLASVALHDRVTGEHNASELSNSFFAWEAKSGTDEVTGLPLSRVEDGTGSGDVAPRGCDLSLRIVFISWFAPERAKELYTNYANSMWRERFIMAGFAEWPDERGHGSDIDSGPILLGIGGAASALGIGAVRVGGDLRRLLRLLAQVASARVAIAEQTCDGPTTLYRMLPIRAGYVTGILFGDAVLFFALAAPLTAD
jgi:hypothetical protein